MNSNIWWHVFVYLGSAILLGVALCANPHPQAAAAQQAQVRIDNFSFSPATLTVAAGTTVQWTNGDDIPHTVVSEDKTSFKSKAMDSDDSFSFTFRQPGTYAYFCSIHPKMTGKVVVQ